MSRRFQAWNEAEETPSRAQNAGIERPLEVCRRRRCRQDAFEMGIFGACHELAPGLEKGDQPSSIAALARLV